MTILIKNGRVIDPANHLDAPKDILIARGSIKAIEPPGKISITEAEKASIIDAKGCVVCPGFIDMHVHFREPGFEYKETIESGCQSAAAGKSRTEAPRTLCRFTLNSSCCRVHASSH